MISIDTLTVTLIVGSVIPLAVAFLTKAAWSSSVKAILNALLAAVAGSFSALLLEHGHLRWQAFVIAGASTYLVSGSTHSHLWKPTGLTDTVSGITG